MVYTHTRTHTHIYIYIHICRISFLLKIYILAYIGISYFTIDPQLYTAMPSYSNTWYEYVCQVFIHRIYTADCVRLYMHLLGNEHTVYHTFVCAHQTKISGIKDLFVFLFYIMSQLMCHFTKFHQECLNASPDGYLESGMGCYCLKDQNQLLPASLRQRLHANVMPWNCFPHCWFFGRDTACQHTASMQSFYVCPCMLLNKQWIWDAMTPICRHNETNCTENFECRAKYYCPRFKY